jgi:hypothetical protein
MIDFGIQQKIIRTAEHAALLANQMDLGEIWSRLRKADLRHLPNTPRHWYGALPMDEPVDFHQRIEPESGLSIAGIDGSQIMPDVYDPAPWVYLQAVVYRTGQKPHCRSRFFDLKSLTHNQDPSQTAYQAFLRLHGDLPGFVLEQRTLLELGAGIPLDGNTVILLDNPLIPWGDYGRQGESSYLNDYLRLFVQYRGRPLAGIISMPRSRLLWNLLMLAEGKSEGEGVWSWQGVTDGQLLGYHLQPGERSALFQHGSWRNQAFIQQEAGIHFFFLKVNDYEVLRVDLPAWVAEDRAAVEKLHAAILKDSLPLGYPYTLSCAHYHALIKTDLAESLRALGTRTYLQHHGFHYLPAKMRMKAALSRV